jgi:hypothetical protein
MTPSSDNYGWEAYLAQFAIYKRAYQAFREARDAFDEQFLPIPADVLPGDHWNAHQGLYKELGLHRSSPAWNRESRKLASLTKAIRKAKAETLFGVGVKLSVTEHFEEFDIVEGAKDARRALAALTGVDFLQTGSLLAEEAA